MRVTPCKVEEPLQGMELQKKKKEKTRSKKKAVEKEPKDKRCLLSLDIKSWLDYISEELYLVNYMVYAWKKTWCLIIINDSFKAVKKDYIFLL